MGQRYDVSLKSLFLREGDGIIRRLLFGPGRIVEFLLTEQPKVLNTRADIVARTEAGGVRQVEFQAQNEAGFGFRIMEYYPFLVRMYGEPVTQIVLYLGRDPMRLENFYRSESMDFRFKIVNLRELDANPLLDSDDLADNVLALLAKGSPEKALEIVVPRIAALQGDDRGVVEASLVILSGIIGMEETVTERFKELGMIDVSENKVLGPLIKKRLEREFEQGLSQGLASARRMLRSMLILKFGPLSPMIEKRLAEASSDELDHLVERFVHASSVDEVFN